MVLVLKAHQGITDRLEALDQLDPREAQVEPGPLDGPDNPDVMDILDILEQRELSGQLEQQDTVVPLVR